MINPILTTHAALTMRALTPPTEQKIERILLLLHGWTGDENTMWIFIRSPLPGALILAPRGLVEVKPTGFGWFSHGDSGFETKLENILPAAENLLSLIDGWLEKENCPPVPLDVVGFSQGAALGGVLAAVYPERVKKAALLSGFVPPDLSSKITAGSLSNSRIFISHGRKDNIIPYHKAEATASLFSTAGAKVTFCPSNSGHKLDLACARNMEDFLSR